MILILFYQLLASLFVSISCLLGKSLAKEYPSLWIDLITRLKKIFRTAKEKSEKNNTLTEDDDFLDLFLLIIEWNDTNLQQRRILKAAITNGMSWKLLIYSVFMCSSNICFLGSEIGGFVGVNPFRANASNHNGNVNASTLSNSVFLIRDTNATQKHQTAVDIVEHLRQTYF